MDDVVAFANQELRRFVIDTAFSDLVDAAVGVAYAAPEAHVEAAAKLMAGKPFFDALYALGGSDSWHVTALRAAHVMGLIGEACVQQSPRIVRGSLSAFLELLSDPETPPAAFLRFVDVEMVSTIVARGLLAPSFLPFRAIVGDLLRPVVSSDVMVKRFPDLQVRCARVWANVCM